MFIKDTRKLLVTSLQNASVETKTSIFFFFLIPSLSSHAKCFLHLFVIQRCREVSSTFPDLGYVVLCFWQFYLMCLGTCNLLERNLWEHGDFSFPLVLLRALQLFKPLTCVFLVFHSAVKCKTLQILNVQSLELSLLNGWGSFNPIKVCCLTNN